MAADGTTTTAPAAVNQVRLVGRLAARAEQRTLPSGDSVWTLRVIVDRPAGAGPGAVRGARNGGHRGSARVDTVDCAVWSGRLRRTVAGWSPGDVVEVEGALRRRFYRAGGSVASRVEIELGSGRVIRRAASG